MALTRNSTFTDPQIENEFQYLFKNCDFNNVEVDLKVKNGKYLYLYSPDNTESIYIYHGGTDAFYWTTTGGHLFLGGHALYVYDSTNADFVKWEHDGTDAIGTVNAGDLYLNIAGNLKFGTHAAVTTETLSGYITVKDAAGNTRKLGVVS